ncbi:MAG: hypothetical protein H0X38_02820 [Planctomycetes bacterium]|nr:hypothetical protein [Planctomycetota bacterium]
MIARPFVRLLTSLSGICLLLCGGTALAASDLMAEVRAAQGGLKAVMPELEEMVTDGRLAAANERLLQVFPAPARSPAQSLLLGNVLFGMDPKASYALHREAALGALGDKLTIMEWALEQHRAGEYAGALASYDHYSMLEPDFAPVHGLAADCLIRLGRTRDAVARWMLSEKARRGTLDDLESLVCAVHGDATLQGRRADLCARVRTGDSDAAALLIALDSDFARDWWNRGPQRAYLRHDLALLAPLAGPRIAAARCAGECRLDEEPKADDVRALLLKAGLITDAAHTLPTDPVLVELLLQSAISAEVLTRKQAQAWFGTRLHAQAKVSNDATLWNVVAYLQESGQPADPAMHALEKEAWDACADPRFAVGWFASAPAGEHVRLDDPLLLKALAQFPDDALLLHLAITAAPPSEALLVQGIKAEYHHFSATGMTSSINGRPAARTLRAYFAALDRLPGAQ